MFSDNGYLKQMYDEFYPMIDKNSLTTEVYDYKIFDLGQSFDYEYIISIHTDIKYNYYDISRTIDIFFNQQMSFNLYSVLTEKFHISSVCAMIRSRKTNKFDDAMLTFSMPFIVTTNSSLIKYAEQYIPNLRFNGNDYIFASYRFNYKLDEYL